MLLLAVLRYALIVPAALILNRVALDGWLRLSEPFQVAFFMLLILPSPFIIPIFMQRASAADRAYVNNALTVMTVISLVLFAIYLGLHPTL